MNSLEALDRLVELCKYSTSKIFTKPSEMPDMICGYPIEYIRQDLEVLEIIKNKYVNVALITLTKYCENYNFVVGQRKALTEEEFEKVKEWLKREK